MGQKGKGGQDMLWSTVPQKQLETGLPADDGDLGGIRHHTVHPRPNET